MGHVLIIMYSVQYLSDAGLAWCRRDCWNLNTPSVQLERVETFLIVDCAYFNVGAA